MRKVFVTLGTVALLVAVAYGIYQWALDGNGPTGKELVRRQILKVIDEAEVLVTTAKKKVRDFDAMVGDLNRATARSLYHAQSLVEKEARAQHGVSVIESELRFMKDKMEKKEPLRYVDGSVMTPVEVELRVISRGEELAAARECLQIITSERVQYEKLHNEQVQKLRLAPSHRQVLQVRLAALDMKLKLYRERQERLDQNLMAGEDLYTALYNEAKQAIGEAEATVTPALSTVDDGFKPLLRDGSEEKISSSGASTDRALARIDALLAGK